MPAIPNADAAAQENLVIDLKATYPSLTYRLRGQGGGR